MKKTAKIIARAGIVGALYVVLTLAVAPIAFSAFQFRISEALTILPLLFPETVIGLTIGCLIANIFGNGVLDLVLGPTATLLAGLLTAFIGKHIHNVPLKLTLGALPPILFNAIIVPFTFMSMTEGFTVYLFNMASVGFGQLVVIAVLGPLVYFASEKIAQRLDGGFSKKGKKNTDLNIEVSSEQNLDNDLDNNLDSDLNGQVDQKND